MKTRELDINEDGYSVRCNLTCGTDDRTHDRVIICTHGFGGTKDIASIQKFAEKEVGKHKKDAVLAFDWPCHGRDARKKLELEECFSYLSIVVNYAKRELGATHLYIYSVSFGAYLTLAYLQAHGNPFDRIALRSCGIHMAQLMERNVAPADRAKFDRGKEVEVGFDRKMKIDRSLIDDLAAHDITKQEFFDWADDIIMLHGENDEFVPIDQARAFADDNVIEFIAVPGCDHAFRTPKNMDFAIHTVVEFFSPRD
jgi:pimeloyl-ACP methyl ester carboxylesterase